MIYWGLWPVQVLVEFVVWMARLTWMLIIVTNPLFLAIWLMGRDRRRREEDEGS